MTDHCEEQEMEAEALSAIFDTSFEVLKDEQPFKWTVKLVPVDGGADEENHVAIKIIAEIPLEYPENSLPVISVQVVKGLAEDHRRELEELAQNEAENNEGMPAIFAICEALREWLSDNNVKGLDDASMYAQMIRKQKEEERSKALAQQEFESQKAQEQISQAELEELEVRTRRQEGTQCTKEAFEAWKAKFDEEMLAIQAAAEEALAAGKKKEKVVDKSGRLTGFQQFSGKAGTINMEDIEAAAEELGNDVDASVEVEELDIDEDLFDEDDVDLDDMDFDDDTDDEEPDI